MRRPRSELASVIIHQKGDQEWIPRKLEVNSWVTLNAPKRGKWAQHGDIKAIVKGFRLKPKSQVVEAVRVAHVYTFKQLQLESKAVTGNINYLYPTNFEDWESPACILDVIVVIHAEIGELMRGSRSHKQLLDAGVFFYNARYVPPIKQGNFGKLVPLPLPALDDPCWPVPDMHTSESFRNQLFFDFQRAMKPTTGGRVSSLKCFMPMHCMVDLFCRHPQSDMHRTKTLLVFRAVTDDVFASLMDPGWDEKIVAGKDFIRCTVLRASVSFRYHIGRSMLYTTFGYIRHRLVQTEWVAMDQAESLQMLSMEVQLLDRTRTQFHVGNNWTFKDLRNEIGFYLTNDQADLPWGFRIVQADKATRKVNRRLEEQFHMDSIGEGSSLLLEILK